MRKLREIVLNLLQKDLSAALELGKELGVELPVAELPAQPPSTFWRLTKE